MHAASAPILTREWSRSESRLPILPCPPPCYQVSLHLAETVLINPYFAASAGLLPRLAQRLLEGEESVRGLLAPGALPEGARVCGVAFRREWVRFSTPEERRATGAWWVDAPTEHRRWAEGEAETEVFRREDLATEGRDSALYVPPLTELPVNGFWAVCAAKARARQRSLAAQTAHASHGSDTRSA